MSSSVPEEVRSAFLLSAADSGCSLQGSSWWAKMGADGKVRSEALLRQNLLEKGQRGRVKRPR